jgi:transposase-like protein
MVEQTEYLVPREWCTSPGPRDPDPRETNDGQAQHGPPHRGAQHQHLAISKLRQGSYYSEWLLEPRRRSETSAVEREHRELRARVSTRRVERLVATLGVAGISKSRVSALVASLDDGLAAFRGRPLESDRSPEKDLQHG